MFNRTFRKIVAAWIVVIFFVTTTIPSYAQSTIPNLPVPGSRVGLSSEFTPLLLKGVKIDPLNPLTFDFIVDTGDLKPSGELLKTESEKLIKYFLAALTTSEKDLWVNLSPYEQNRIVPSAFGQTDMGHDLLAQDYLLKQITASLIYPEDSFGRTFWKKVYSEAKAKFGTADISVDAFNKVWIIPAKATVYEHEGNAFVIKSRLKVLLEEDYVAMSHENGTAAIDHPKAGIGGKETDKVGSRIVREIVLPALEKEVNEGKNFAQLRQIYTAFILAAWYKQALKKSILSRKYVDQNKVSGIDVDDKEIVQKIFSQYVSAYKKGVYNYIKEDVDEVTGRIVPRKYFAGGVSLALGANGADIGGPNPVPELEVVQQATGEDVAAHGDFARITTRLDNTKPADSAAVQDVTVTGAVDEEKLKEIKRNPRADVYADPSQNFQGISLEHFIVAQRRLANRDLTIEELQNLLRKLEIIGLSEAADPSSADAYYQKIYETLARQGYTKDDVDLINTYYEDPRLNVTIIDQNGNPKGQGILEAVSNSVDALGGNIGQFGKGVKQIVDWLEPNGRDRIDVFTRQVDASPYQLTIINAANGQWYIQVREITAADFNQAAGAGVAHGTVVSITVNKPVPLDSFQIRGPADNSLHGIMNNVHQRFAFVRSINIDTSIEGESPRHVNGWETRKAILPFGQAVPTDEDKGGRNIRLELSAKNIKIIDNGLGMDVARIARMFVPAGGDKQPVGIKKEEDVVGELNSQLAVIHDQRQEFTRETPVLVFARNQETILNLKLDGINRDALVDGHLMLELGRLVQVQQARDKIVFSLEFDTNGVPLIQRGILEAVDRILTVDDSQLTSSVKLKYINTIVAGLEKLIAGNPGNEIIVKRIRDGIKNRLSPFIQSMRERNTVFLPHDEGFAQLQIPDGKSVVYLNPYLFDWSRERTLKSLGGQVVDKSVFRFLRNIDGEERSLTLIAVPFKNEFTKAFSEFNGETYPFKSPLTLPIINGDSFIVVPLQFAQRFLELADLRLKDQLNDETLNREFRIFAQLIKSAVDDETITSYEVNAVRHTVALPEIDRSRFKFSKGEIDSDAVNRFLTRNPPNVTGQAEVSQAMAVPSDASMQYMIDQKGNIIDILTGTMIEEDIYDEYEMLKPLGGDLYYSKSVFKPGHKSWTSIKRIVAGVAVNEYLGGVEDEVKLLFSSQGNFIFNTPVAGGKGLDEFEVFDVRRGKEIGIKSGLDYFVNRANISIQMSADERFITVSEDKGEMTSLGIYDLQLETFKEVLVSQADGSEYRLDPRAPMAIMKRTNGMEIFIDLRTGTLITESANAVTEPGGKFTVFVDAGKIRIFVHDTSAYLTSKNFNGQDISSVMFDWDKDGRLEADAITLGNERAWMISPEGKILQAKNSVDENLKYTWHISADGKTEITDHEGDPRFEFPSGPSGRFVASPEFDLLIDQHDPQNHLAINMVTGERIPFEGHVVRFYPEAQTISGNPGSAMYVRSANGELRYYDYFYSSDKDTFKSLGWIAASSQSRYIVTTQKTGETYSFWDLSKYALPQSVDLNIRYSDYPDVIFDGKYFVFINSSAGTAVYVDPAHPEHAFDGSDIDAVNDFLTSKKPDAVAAPDRYQLVRDINGRTGIMDPESGKIVTRPMFQISGVEHEMLFDPGASVVHLGGNVYAVINPQQHVSIINEQHQWTMDQRYTYHSHSGSFVILNDSNGGQMLLDSLVTSPFDPESFVVGWSHEKIQISPSGRYAVFEDKDEIFYVDLTSDDYKPIKIEDKTGLQSYRVDDQADILIYSSTSGLSKVFDLATQDWIRKHNNVYTAKSAVMDSSGNFMIFQEENGVALYNLRAQQWLGDLFMIDAAIVRIAQDDQYVYLVITSATPFGDLILRYERNPDGSLNPAMKTAYDTWVNFLNKNGKAYTLSWSEYDEDGVKVSRLNESQEWKIMAPLQNYQAVESGKTIVNNNARFYYAQNKLEVSFPGLTGFENRYQNAQLLSLKGNKVVYLQGPKGNIYGYSLNESQWLDAPDLLRFTELRILANADRTFIYDQRKDEHRLYDADGIVYDVAGIPDGFYLQEANGRTFVFYNPQSNKFLFFDPVVFVESSGSAETGVMNEIQRRAIELWSRDVLNSSQTQGRDYWIAQARLAYDGLFKLLERVPEDHRAQLQEHLQKTIEGIYADQESSLRSQFIRAFRDKAVLPDGITFDQTLPLNEAGRRAGIILKVINETSADGVFFDNLIKHLVQEQVWLQQSSLASLFDGIAALIRDQNLNEDLFNEEFLRAFFPAALLGWKAVNQDQIENMPVISTLIKELAEMNVSMETQRKIVRFLSASSADPQAAPAVFKQLNRILRDGAVAGDVRRNYLDQMAKAFEKTPEKRIIDSVKDPKELDNLGKIKDFIVFLTTDLNMIQTKDRVEPSGTDLVNDTEGVGLDQLMNAYRKGRFKTIGEMIENFAQIKQEPILPQLAAEINQLVSRQKEAGGEKAEIVQNSKDAGAKNLIIRYYKDTITGEFIEEAADDGAGPSELLALLLLMSTKADKNQLSQLSGFFGTGKLTYYAGVDRVEWIVNNGQDAYMLVINVNAESNGVRLTRVRRLDVSEISRGVTVRRIKKAQHTIPELDQMLGRRSWKVFGSMSNGRNGFTLSIQEEDREGRVNLSPITVKGKELLAEADFNVLPVSAGQEPLKMRIWGKKDADMPNQWLDKNGLRVEDLMLKEKFLAFIPEFLRHYIDDLGLMIEIPLPLIQNRSSYEREDEQHFEDIQKYVTIEFFRALVRKALTDESFVLDDFSRDWEISPDDRYYDVLEGNRQLVDLVERMNNDDYEHIDVNELAELGRWLSDMHSQEKMEAFMKFIVRLEAKMSYGKASLLDRRIATQMKINAEKTRLQAQRLGVDLDQALAMQDEYGAKREEFARKLIKDLRNYKLREAETPQEEILLKIFKRIGEAVGFKDVYIVDREYPASAAFWQGKMVVNAALADLINQQGIFNGHVFDPVDGVVHELAHYFEQRFSMALLGEEVPDDYTFVSGDEPAYTHQTRGRFSTFYRMIAMIALAKLNQESVPGPENDEDDVTPVVSKADRSAVSSDAKSADSDVGGIDFNPVNLQLQVEGDGSVSSMIADRPDFESMEIEGLRPVILEVTPIGNLPVLLGMMDDKPTQLSSAR